MSATFKSILKWLAGTLIFLTLLLHTIPYVARDLVVWSLYQQGADRVALKKLNIKWFSGELSLEEFELIEDEQTAIAFKYLLADLNLKALSEKKIYFSDLRLEDSQINLSQVGAQLLLGPLVLADSSQPASPASEGMPSLQFGLDRFALNNVDFYLAQTHSNFDLSITEFSLAKLYQWEPNAVTQIKLDGLFNGAPLNLDSSARPLPERKDVSIQVVLSDLALEPLGAFLEKDLRGSVSTQLDLEILLETDDTIRLSQSGQISLSNLGYRDELLAVEVDEISWDGAASEVISLGGAADTASPLKQITSASKLQMKGLNYKDASNELALNSALFAPDINFDLATGQVDARLKPQINQLFAKLDNRALTADLITADFAAIRKPGLPIDLASIMAGFIVEGELQLQQAAFTDEGATLDLKLGQMTLTPNLRWNAETKIPNTRLAFSLSETDLSQQSAETSLLADEVVGELNYSLESNQPEALISVNFSSLDVKQAGSEVKSTNLELSARVLLSETNQPTEVQADITGDALSLNQPTLNVIADAIVADLNYSLGGNQAEAQVNVDLPSLYVKQAESEVKSTNLALSARVLLSETNQPTEVQADITGDALSLNQPTLNVIADAIVADLNYTLGGNQAEASVSVNLPSLYVKQAESEVKSTNLALSARTLLSETNQPTEIQTDITGDAFSLSQPTLNLGSNSFSINAQASQADSSRWQAELATSILALKLNQAELGLQLNQVDLNGPFALLLDDNAALANIEFSAPVKLEGLNLESGATKAQIRQLTLTPDLNIGVAQASLAGSLGVGLSETNAELSAEQSIALAALSADLKIDLNSGSQQVSGPIDISEPRYTSATDVAQLSRFKTQADGNFTPAGSVLNITLKQTELEQLSGTLKTIGDLSLQAGAVAEISWLNNQLRLQDLSLDDFIIGWADDSTPYFALKALTMNQLDWSPAALAIGKVSTQELAVHLRRNAEAQLNLTRGFEPTASSEETSKLSEQQASGTEDEPNFNLRLDRFETTGGLEVSYQDLSLASPLTTNLMFSVFYLENYDSSSAEQTVVKAKGQINQRGDINLDARFNQLDKKFNGEWKLDLTQISLPTLSSLVQSTAGYQINNGVLNINSTGNIEGNQILGENAVRLQRLEVTRVQSDRATATDQLFTMPLSTALSLLEDSDRVIELDIPVTGDVNDPKFSYEDIIQLVVTKSVKEGALAFLSNSLQPYGALISIVTAVADAESSGRFIQLQPMLFAEGAKDLNADARDYANKLADMMQQRPGLTLEICPVALLSEETLIWEELKTTLTDKELESEDIQKVKLANAMNQLANDRADELNNFIQSLGVPKERVLICLPKIGVEGDQPRVDLSF